jgi:ABC-type transport system involved in multi-copper enzyme maturation permease subunit
VFTSTLALFTRAFRVDARSPRPHVLRFLFVGVILLELIGVHQMDLLFGAPGLTVFKSIAWLNFAVITFSGIGYFSSAISEEKEEDSLGLLKMAGISPAALLLGKSTTRMLTLLLLLAVEFPFILLSITLGGVTMTQVIAMSVALAAYLIFVANLGLIFSVIATNARQASTLVTLSLILLLIVLPIAAQVLTFAMGTYTGTLVKTLVHWEEKTSMWSRLSIISSTGFAENPVSAQVVCHLLAALGFFGLSWMGFERFTRERNAVARTDRILALPAPPMAQRRIDRAWSKALMWKDFYFVNGGVRMVRIQFVLFFALIAGFCVLLTYLNSWRTQMSLKDLRQMVGVTAMISMFVAAIVELGLVSSRVFRDEVQAHTLPLLMMLPKSTAEIAWSKAAAVLPTLIPAAVYFLLGALLNIDDLGRGLENLVFTWGFAVSVVWFVFFLHLAAYLSLVIKWGALPLAIFLVYVFQMFLLSIFMSLRFMIFGPRMGSDFPMTIIQLLIGLGAIVLLEYRIGRRLRHLAGQ